MKLGYLDGLVVEGAFDLELSRLGFDGEDLVRVAGDDVVDELRVRVVVQRNQFRHLGADVGVLGDLGKVLGLQKSHNPSDRVHTKRRAR